ncbi:MAG: hypothetical protein ABDH16_02375 [Thermodesulfovibrionaceae bacterium]
MVVLIFILIFASSCFAQDVCGDLVIKVVKPVPAMVDGKLLDAKEKFEYATKYIDTVSKVTKLLGEYLQLRKEIDEKGAYYGWQWKRVEAGVEYKRDIWKEYIKDYTVLKAQFKNIERQLISLGITQQELDLCYKQSK